MKPHVVVIRERCNGCKLCVKLCPASVFELIDGIAVPVRGDKCILCYGCVAICERKAIIVEDLDP